MLQQVGYAMENDEDSVFFYEHMNLYAATIVSHI
jgi:hypothetical protein